MKGIKRALYLLLVILFCAGMTACSSSSADAGDAQKSQMEKLEPVTQLSADGVITEEQMKTIADSEGEYRFCGIGEGFTYTWIYNAKMIKNPQEQKLKVTRNDSDTETVKKEANNATVGMGIQLETMHMAAPATLEIILEESWDADTVILCKYKDSQVYKMADVSLDNSGGSTVLTFQVAEVGDTYYLVGGKSVVETESSEASSTDETEEQGENAAETTDTTSGASSSSNSTDNTSNTGAQEQSTETVEMHTCTISIECSTILNNWDDLDQSKAEFVPANGWILYPSEVEFTPGETVFDVLKRVCSQTGIHMSSRYTPMYGSYYIEGINQLYEFDCGQNSGWMYRVNGWYPNYGCSSYELSDGDNIEWRYTCDLGVDVGGGEY